MPIKGSCHCGKVRYEADLDLGAGTGKCNCSICAKRGALWAFGKPSQVKILKGESALTDYQFGKKRIHHLFCATCGIQSFAHGKGPGGAEMVAVNVRCLDGVEVDSLPVKKVDGRKF